MAARLSIMLFLLEEAKKRDDLEKRRQAYQIRNFRTTCREIDFIKNYRLSEDLIIDLEKELKPFLPVSRRSGGLSRRLKILCTLSFLATGSYQKILSRNVETYISQSSVSRAIHQVVNALNNRTIIRKYIRFPQNANERQALKESFYEKFHIPGVLGCIDGTLVAMIRPQHNEERYYCRKGYHATNILIVSSKEINDADLNILHVDATFGGATHDSFVFANSSIKQHLETLHNNGETVYLLGDSGYAQRPYLMTPCNDAVPGSPEEHYNNLHLSARNSVERTIGVLKGRFRCLLVHRVLHYDPAMVAKIVKACSVLHNICNRAGLAAPALGQQDIEEENRLSRTLLGSQTSVDSLAGGRLCRQQLINQLWRAQAQND